MDDQAALEHRMDLMRVTLLGPLDTVLFSTVLLVGAESTPGSSRLYVEIPQEAIQFGVAEWQEQAGIAPGWWPTWSGMTIAELDGSEIIRVVVPARPLRPRTEMFSIRPSVVGGYLAFEEEFGIDIPDEDTDGITPTIQGFVDYLAGKLGITD